jgi:isoquinoline 1-oxidoreductase subunit beta
MNELFRIDPTAIAPRLAGEGVVNLSRRGFLGAAAGALVLCVMLSPRGRAWAQAEGAGAVAPKPGTRVPAFLEIHGDGSIKLLSPFVEGGQGANTGLVQIVAEELDVDPARFTAECAPPGPDYAVVNGIRMTGGSFSTRSSYAVMRQLGATARDMMIRAAAARLKVQDGELTTRDGVVEHKASGRSLTYAELAVEALALKPREIVPLRDPATFRYIGKPLARLETRDKSTGKAVYTIDMTVDGMLYAAVQHSPHFGVAPQGFDNEAEVKAMPGVHSVHSLPNAAAIVADSWWRARRPSRR